VKFSATNFAKLCVNNLQVLWKVLCEIVCEILCEIVYAVQGWCMHPWGSPNQPQVNTYALPSSASKLSAPLLQSAIPYRVKPHAHLVLTAISCHFRGYGYFRRHSLDQHTI